MALRDTDWKFQAHYFYGPKSFTDKLSKLLDALRNDGRYRDF